MRVINYIRRRNARHFHLGTFDAIIHGAWLGLAPLHAAHAELAALVK
jgi:hypothetical protein